jgi:hypothetical protein
MSIATEEKYAVIGEPPVPVSGADVKALARHRDAYRCTLCGMTAAEHVEKYGRNLDVHRKTPGSKYTLKGVQTVCRDCHFTLPKSAPGADGLTNRGDCLLRVRKRFADLLDVLAERMQTNATQELNRAVREILEREGLWPDQNKPK